MDVDIFRFSSCLKSGCRMRVKTACNWLLAILVAVPAILYQLHLKTSCSLEQYQAQIKSPLVHFHHWFSWTNVCALSYQHPIVAVNVVFFLNVDVLFWLIGILQRSSWLIDPYWTIIPPMIGLFYQHHPAAVSDRLRSLVVMTLVWVWSIRLTHSYMRREEWQLGAREDWRFTKMSKAHPGHWWWKSFFITYVSQHLMLVGITLPLFSVHFVNEPWHPVWDTVAAVACALGLGIAHSADTSLRSFMVANEKRRAAGEKPQLLLEQGLWFYSRHPNYFGEQLWWWGIALFGIRLGQPWTAVGTLFNSICMVEVTRMTEARMLAVPERAEAFRRYQRTTSAWVPFFKGTDGREKQQ